MNLQELERAKAMKDRLNKVGSGFCLAKWDQVTMHLGTGMTHSCHHPAPHRVSLEDLKDNPTAIHNSKQKLEQRSAMLNGERPSPCNYCWKMEDANPDTISDRYLKSANLFDSRFDKIRDSGTGKKHIPSYLEVSFSNVCNLKCNYCGPTFSSKWQREQETSEPIMLFDDQSEKQHWEYHNLEYLERRGEIPYKNSEHNPYVEAFWEWWPELREEIKYLRLTGGEPLMAKDTFRLLEEIETNPIPDLEFSLNTNLNTPQKNWDRFIEFIKRNEDNNIVKKVTLFTSIDGWGKQAEYVRSGLDFNLLWERLNYLIEEHPTVDNTIMTTYSLMSIPSYGKFLKEVHALKQKYNKYNGRFVNYAEFFKKHNLIDEFDRGIKPCALHLDISTMTFPNFMDVTIPPRELTMPMVWDQYDFMMKNLTAGPDNKNFYDYEAEKMGRVVDYVYYAHQEKENLEELREFWTSNFYIFTDALDKRRGTDFVKTYPEYEDFFDMCKQNFEKIRE